MSRLEVNRKIPDFEYNQEGRYMMRFYDRRKTRYTVLLFLRFMGCRFTQYDVLTYAKHMPQFQQQDTQVWAIIQSPWKRIEEHYSPSLPPFMLIGDPEAELYHRFGVLPAKSKEEMEGTHFHDKIALVEKAGLAGGIKEGEPWQMPAAIVVNQNNQIIYTYYGKEAADTPSPEKILEQLK